jgi:hypothetical protein
VRAAVASHAVVRWCAAAAGTLTALRAAAIGRSLLRHNGSALGFVSMMHAVSMGWVCVTGAPRLSALPNAPPKRTNGFHGDLFGDPSQ